MRNPSIAILALICVGSALATKTYSDTTGTRAMYYAGASYCAKQTIVDWNCGEPCTANSNVKSVTKIENTGKDTFGYVAYSAKDNEVIVAFRGTNGLDFENWITNLQYKQVDYKSVSGAKVHYGFYDAYSAVSSSVISAVKALLSTHSGASIMITGHSLGGALATLAALDIKEQINPSNKIYFYTFGSPRVGNQQFSDYVIGLYNNGGYSRVTHYNDVVPHMPLTAQGFNHAGNEVWYKNDGTDLFHIECENSAGKSESWWCSDSLLITTGIDAHLTYLGKPISDMCTQKEKSNSNEINSNEAQLPEEMDEHSEEEEAQLPEEMDNHEFLQE